MLAIWFIAKSIKSTRICTCTGLSPEIAAPKAAPVIASSDNGVPKHRSLPNFSTRPLVLPKMRLWSGTSRPKTKTEGSASISLTRARLTASLKVMSDFMRIRPYKVLQETETERFSRPAHYDQPARSPRSLWQSIHHECRHTRGLPPQSGEEDPTCPSLQRKAERDMPHQSLREGQRAPKTGDR